LFVLPVLSVDRTDSFFPRRSLSWRLNVRDQNAVLHGGDERPENHRFPETMIDTTRVLVLTWG